MKKLLFYSVIALSTFLYSCNTSNFDLAKAEKEIDAINDAYAMASDKGDAAAIANLYTIDGKMFLPGKEEIIGRQNIRTATAGLLIKDSKTRFTPTGFWGTADLLVDEGLMTVTDKNGKTIEENKYLGVWKKENGDWKLFRDMTNAKGKTGTNLSFDDVIGDTLHYVVGDAVFDIVIKADNTLYWKSYNPKYGTEAHEKITVIPISDSENMISYVENGKIGVCWYNDFHREKATVSVFVGPDLMTFSGTVKLKR